MKASEIKKLVTGSKRVLIWVDGSGNQWIGDGMRGMYAADDCIRLNEGNVLSVLDVDKDKREKIRCSMGPSYDPRLSILPDEENDIRLRPVLSVYYADELITLMRSDDTNKVPFLRDGVFFHISRYLPFFFLLVT